jgi:mannose-6-phosphate isomerase-like protein (cupin superfamily)
LQLQLGTETFTLEPQTLVRVPAGTPHHSWNSSSAEEMHIEVIVTPPPVEQLITAAEPRKIANAASLIRRVKHDAFEPTAIKGSAVQWLARRDSGSPHAAINLEQSEPNAGAPELHIHGFDQIYFVTEGIMHVQLGLKQFAAKPNTFVIIPAGTVHRQWNAGNVTEKHLTLLLPEPKPGEPMDVSVALGKDLATAPK